MPALDIPFLEAMLVDLNTAEKYPIFVETGTHVGSTIFGVEPMFEELHTIEIKEEFYEEARKKYEGDKISFHLGDSSLLLGDIVKELKQPTIFFLDGHWSSGNTGKGKKDVPLYEELCAIRDNFSHKAIIIIDDYNLFGKGPQTGLAEDWSDITTHGVLKLLKERLGSWRSGESIILGGIGTAGFGADRLLISLGEGSSEQ